MSCSLVGYLLTCSFSTWAPPLLDTDYASSPGHVIVNDVNGVIPSNSFSGLDNSDAGYTGTPQLNLDCGFATGNTMTLLSDSLSSNLAWVEEMMVSDCTSMVIEANAFSSLTSLTRMTIIAGNFSSISPSAFSGLTSLNTLYLYADFPAGGVPAGLFSGLEGLVNLDMSRTAMNSLPAGLFNDLHNLTELILQESSLTTLPGNLFLPLFSITTLDLTVNAWVCDCKLQWLADYLINTGLTSATCGSPADLAGYDLTRALPSLTCQTVEETAAEENPWWRYGLVGGASLALLVALIACCMFCHQRSLMEDQLREAKIAAGKAATQKTPPPAYSNQAYADDNGMKNGGKPREVTSISFSTEESSYDNGDQRWRQNAMHSDSPLPKRNNRITPSAIRLQKAWGMRQDVNAW